MGLGKRLRSLFDSRARGSIPEDETNLVQRLLDDFCEHRVHPELRSKLWYTYRVEGCRVELIENRPFFLNPDKTTEMEIARFEYEPGLGACPVLPVRRNVGARGEQYGEAALLVYEQGAR